MQSVQVPSPSLTAWAEHFFLQAPKRRAGLGWAVPCRCNITAGPKHGEQGIPFTQLACLAVNCTTARLEIHLLNSFQGEGSFPQHSQVPTEPGPTWAVSGAFYCLGRWQQIYPSQPPTQQSACPVKPSLLQTAALFACLHLISASVTELHRLCSVQGSQPLWRAFASSDKPVHSSQALILPFSLEQSGSNAL